MATRDLNFRREDGVLIQDATAPSLMTLRPVTPGDPGKTFPVYADLSEQLLNPSNPFEPGRVHPDKTVAHTLGVCAGYSYSDAETVSTMMARMGLENNRCRLIGEYVDAMFIESTAFIVQSHDGKIVILAYRGTEPVNLINWLTDVDVSPTMVSLPAIGSSKQAAFDLHAGFYRNVRATRYKVTEALTRALGQVPVTKKGTKGSKEEPPELDFPMQTLYITGHSLGGAMAAINTLLMRTESGYRSKFGHLPTVTYTFGQPMIGAPSLAKAATADAGLGSDLIRFIYKKDPVPYLPPGLTGPFAHFGQEYHFEGTAWKHREGRHQATQMHQVAQLLSAGGAFLSRNIPALKWVPFEFDFYDHGPQGYIAALTPEDKVSEFGDYNYVPPQGR